MSGTAAPLISDQSKSKVTNSKMSVVHVVRNVRHSERKRFNVVDTQSHM